jgi:lysine 2,3-aminomutase
MDNELGGVESTEPPSWKTTRRSTENTEPPGKNWDDWDDWKWQFRNRLTSINDVLKYTKNISELASKQFPLAITPYYFSLIKEFNDSDPIFKMCMPHLDELEKIGFTDPLCEDSMMPVKGLVHRYNDRALLVSTTICSMYCRYCTRKRTVGVEEHILQPKELEDIVNYLKKHPEIFDVIISGGDPLIMDTPKIEQKSQL